MPATVELPETSAVTIFGRLLSNGGKRLSPALARHILSLGFSAADKARMHELATRNQQGVITPQEHDELMNYVQAGCLLGVLQSKARQSLKKTRKKAG